MMYFSSVDQFARGNFRLESNGFDLFFRRPLVVRLLGTKITFGGLRNFSAKESKLLRNMLDETIVKVQGHFRLVIFSTK